MTFEERLKACEEFLTHLGHGIGEEERLIASYPDEATVQTGADGKKLNAGFWPKPYKVGKAIPVNKNAYVCISSSIKTENPKTGEMRYWRGEASFSGGYALMVDDIGNGKGSKGDFALDDICRRLEPSAVVETSPDNYQLWYFFKEPVRNMRVFKAFLNCFVNQVLKKGGDNTIKDIARYGRMPIGINNKRNSNGTFKYLVDGKPWQVRIFRCNYEKRYTIDEIAAAFHFTIEIPATREVHLDKEEFKYDLIWFDMAKAKLAAAGMGEGSNGQLAVNQSGKIRIRCPWGHEHGNGDPYGAYFRAYIPGADYAYVFGCAHDVCRKQNNRRWQEFVDEVVMPDIIGEIELANIRGMKGFVPKK